MKRTVALSGMRWLVLLVVFQVGYTAPGALAHHAVDDALLPGYAPSVAVADPEIDDTSMEINPHDYVPLAVGNRWTYEHRYRNDAYPYYPYYPLALDENEGLEILKLFEIPGYLHGRGNPILPDSLRYVERILTIEITHTEMIDGLEYFVFSDADYTWPPVPGLFWGGEKVRVSDAGFLVFRWNGQDVPVYDLDHHHFDELSDNRLKNRYTFTLPGTSGTATVDITRGIYFYSDGLRIYGLRIGGPEPGSQYSVVTYSSGRSDSEFFCSFLRGYGIGQLSTWVLGFEAVIFVNILTPVSAHIDGEEILYPDHTLSSPIPFSDGLLEDLKNLLFLFDSGSSPDTTTSVRPTSWGQLKQRIPVRSSPAQDSPIGQGE